MKTFEDMYYLFIPLLFWSILALIKVRINHICCDNSFDKTSTDAMRVFAAFGIVLVHMPMHIHSPYLPFLEVSGYWNGMIVGFFFFLSGYGLIKSYLIKGNDYLNSFWEKRLKGIVPSAIIAIAIYFIIDVMENVFSVKSFITSLTTGNFIRPAGWFVQTLLIYYLVYYLSIRYIKKLSISLSLMLFFSIIWIFIIRQMEWESYIWSSVLAFNSGTFIAVYERKLKKYFQDHQIMILFCIMIISIIEIALFLYKDRIIPSTLNCAIYPILFMPLMYTTGFAKWKWISFLSGITYEIYLMHFIVLEHSRYWPYRSEYYFILSFILIVIVAYIVKMSSNYLLNIEFYNR